MESSTFIGGDKNHTTVVVFVFMGITDEKELQFILFPVFLGIYLVTLFWNLSLVILIRMDSQLHTPMYFFLSVLSSIDVCYSSSISPRMLSDFFKDEKTISFISCATQYFAASWMGQTECCLLAAMAIDRYMAIGKPLQYSAIMTPGLCQRMVTGAIGTGFICSLIETIPAFQMHYCGPNVIQHFFCNISEIIILSCSSSFITQMILFLAILFVGFGSFLVILLSYGFITVSILKMSSLKGSLKAFNTCASHLAVVIFYYVPVCFVYMRPQSRHSEMEDKVLSVFYIFITPMLNPLIYSLRNKEIKEALKRMLKRTSHFS
ncbi:olfactory receptor 5A1-like [Suncus etruscus]|uniref:olfactory receptor 5A1-like n=1 Tax=Suncus etruscus TaxID=109475 RepID=UPI0021104CE1|nr:olfactory receptor 5A1-like [Suncus etruscus]